MGGWAVWCRVRGHDPRTALDRPGKPRWCARCHQPIT